MATTQKDKAYVIGSSITCTTSHNEVYRGNILAFDMSNKAIMIGILKMTWNKICMIFNYRLYKLYSDECIYKRYP